MLLDDLLDLPLLDVLGLVLLQEENDLGATTQRLSVIRSDGEGSSCRRLPDVLLVVIVFGVDHDPIGDQVGRVEPDTELSDHRDVGSGLESFHEGFGAGLCDGAEVVDEVGFGHADAGVDDGDGFGFLVWNDLDEELLEGVQLGGIGQTFVSDLVQGVGRVGDEFSEEDLLVGVEGVDDEGQQLSDLGLEGEGFGVVCHLEFVVDFFNVQMRL